MKQHSPFGGSQASRYMACPGSVALAEKAPPSKSSAYADEGTFAHALGEVCLLAGERDARNRIDSMVTAKLDTGASTKRVTAEMADAVNVYLETVWAEYDEDEASDIEVEQRFSIKVPAADEGEVFGTNDALVYSPSRMKLTIFDYKHGQGVIVDVEDNVQIKFYALGALQAHPEWDVTEIELVVVQPRAFNAGEERGVKRWSLPIVETIEFPSELDDAIKLAKSPDAPLISGDHCRWCPASIICTAREQEFITAANAGYAGVSLPEFVETVEPERFTEAQPVDFEHIARIVAAYQRLGPWISDLQSHMNEHLLAGGAIPGWKVVEAVARRKWTADEAEISGYLSLVYGVEEDTLRPPTLVTITEAKRLLKAAVAKGEYAEAEKDMTLRFTIKESKGLTTAPDSDKRAAVSPVAAEFGSVQLGSME